jgi:hypothetical protein
MDHVTRAVAHAHHALADGLAQIAVLRPPRHAPTAVQVMDRVTRAVAHAHRALTAIPVRIATLRPAMATARVTATIKISRELK